MLPELFESDLTPAALAYFSSQPILGVDTETTGLEPRTDKLCLVQLSDPAGERVAVVHKPTPGSSNLLSLLSSERPSKVFHHARFDMAFLTHHLGVSIAEPMCTKILAKAIYPYEQATLKWLVERHLGIVLNKGAERLHFVENGADAPVTEEVLLYAARDASVLVPLLRCLESKAGEGPLKKARRGWKSLAQNVAKDLRSAHQPYYAQPSRIY